MNFSDMAKHHGPHRRLERLIIDEQHLGLNLSIRKSGPAAFFQLGRLEDAALDKNLIPLL